MTQSDDQNRQDQKTARLASIPTATLESAAEETHTSGADTERPAAASPQLGTVPMDGDQAATTPRGAGPDAHGKQAPGTSLPRGSTVDRYVVLATIGTGGMGAVYAAYDPRLDRKIALKLVRADRVRSRALAQRLQREAQAIARLSHPNIVTVHDVGYAQSGVYVAMEFVAGQSLRAWQAAKERPWSEIVAMYCQAGRGLGAAHAAGLVHRDFKADNALIGDDGRVRVVDFGLVALTSEPPSQSGDFTATTDSGDSETDSDSEGNRALSERLTVTQAVMGTPAYMAPEQHVGRTTDVRADIFGFCASLYEALYGQRPFETSEKGRRGIDALGRKKLASEIRPRPTSDVPMWLHEAILRGLRADPDERWQAMDELIAVLSRDPRQRRRQIAVALGLSAAILATGAGALYAASSRNAPAPLCPLALDRLAGIWDDARKQEVQAGLLASGASFAKSTALRVEERVNEYAQSWLRMHKDACEATHVRREQSGALLDRRMRCLSRRLGELDAQLSLFAKADRKTTFNALTATAQLSPLSWCADTGNLSAEVEPPADPELRAAVEGLEVRLNQVKALQDSGQMQPALELARTVAEDSAGLAYAPIRAEALARYGFLRLSHEGYDEGHDTLVEAFALAFGQGQDRLVANVARWLLWAKSGKGADSAVVDEWITLARAAAERMGPGGAFEQGEALRAIGVIYDGRGKFEQALAQFERALEVLGEFSGEYDLSVARVYSSIGNTYEILGNLDQARAYQLRALAIKEKISGPDHPDTVLTRKNISNTYLAQGNYEEGLKYAEQALEPLRAAWGTDDSRTAATLENIGKAYLGLGQYDEALARFTESLGIWERIAGDKHPQTASAHSVLGDAYYARRDYEAASLEYERAQAILQASGETNGAIAAALQHNLGVIQSRRGNYQQAAVYLEASLKMAESGYGPDNPEIAYALTNLADAYVGLSQWARAIALGERALALRERHPGKPENLAETRFVLARALAGAGQGERGLALAQQALAAVEGIGKPGSPAALLAADIAAWLASKR